MSFFYRFRQELLHFIARKSMNLYGEVPIIFYFISCSNRRCASLKDHTSTQVLSVIPSLLWRTLLMHFFLLSPESLISYFLLQYSLNSAKLLWYLKSSEQQQIISWLPSSYHPISSLLLQQNFFKGLTVYSGYLHPSSSVIQPIPTWISPQPSFSCLAFTEAVFVKVINLFFPNLLEALD